jgi:hypothetical protein
MDKAEAARAGDGGDATPELPILVQVLRHELQEELRRCTHIRCFAMAASNHLKEGSK